ncbi:oligosaccharide flippase family protein [Salinivibrio proteolyticus]|uniref:Oligosaccharide flippase family protein n=1 Tax=Salinivibrio proteolyticus TaxID=334715 RepID=A0ABY7LCJ5_9GAMM|nr:oligosaccharide flippase family protein [Salinivibrio proteolyticus]WBA13957.1 oligosaccharide flippase family protein [Salinivibrio proteolyticus]
MLDNANNKYIKAIVQTGLYGVLTRFLVQGAQLIIVPIMIKTYGMDYFGLIATLIAFTTASSIAGFGISKGMVNRIPLKIAAGSNVVDYIRQNVFLSIYISIIIFPVVYYIISYFYSNELSTMKMVGEIITIFCISFSLSVVINTLSDVYRGLGKQVYVNQVQFSSSLISMIFTFSILFLELDVIYYAISSMILPNFITAIYYIRRQTGLKHVFNSFTLSLSKLEYTIKNFQFFMLAMVQFLMTNVGLVIVSRFNGTESAGVYNVINKFNLISIAIFSAFTASLWPVISEIKSKNGNISVILKKGKQSTFIYALISFFGMSFIVPNIIYYVMSIDLNQPFYIYVLFATQNVGVIVSSYLIPLFNSFELLKVQIVFGILSVVVNLTLSVILVDAYGLSGVLIASIISHYFLVVLPFYFIYKRKIDVGYS